VRISGGGFPSTFCRISISDLKSPGASPRTSQPFTNNVCEILVRTEMYEIFKADTRNPIHIEDWEVAVNCGVELEMNAFVVRKWSIGIKTCPRCGKSFSMRQMLHIQRR
jgi:hypothetical protein